MDSMPETELQTRSKRLRIDGSDDLRALHLEVQRLEDEVDTYQPITSNAGQLGAEKRWDTLLRQLREEADAAASACSRQEMGCQIDGGKTSQFLSCPCPYCFSSMPPSHDNLSKHQSGSSTGVNVSRFLMGWRRGSIQALMSRAEWAVGALLEVEGRPGWRTRSIQRYQTSLSAWKEQAMAALSFGAVIWKTQPLSQTAIEALQSAARWTIPPPGVGHIYGCQMQRAAGRAALHLLAIHHLTLHDSERLKAAVQSLGFRFCLNPALLQPSPREIDGHSGVTSSAAGTQAGQQACRDSTDSMSDMASPRVAVCDGILPRSLYVDLEMAFAWSRQPESFWMQHRYGHPMTPYHSYAFNITRPSSQSSPTASPSLGSESAAPNPWHSVEAAAYVVKEAIEKRWPGALNEAQVVEWWVHARLPHEGHQLHFDLDEARASEGRGLIHPILSTVLFLSDASPTDATRLAYDEQLTSAEAGQLANNGPSTAQACQNSADRKVLACGATLVTSQKLGDHATPHNTAARKLICSHDCDAHSGWAVFPRRNRLLVFDGNLLHGVLPPPSINSCCRTSQAPGNSDPGTADLQQQEQQLPFARNTDINAEGLAEAVTTASDCRRLTLMMAWHRHTAEPRNDVPDEEGSGVTLGPMRVLLRNASWVQALSKRGLFLQDNPICGGIMDTAGPSHGASYQQVEIDSEDVRTADQGHWWSPEKLMPLWVDFGSESTGGFSSSTSNRPADSDGGATTSDILPDDDMAENEKPIDGLRFFLQNLSDMDRLYHQDAFLS